MSVDQHKARSIFISMVENYAPDQWPGMVGSACEGDVDLRRRVEMLLQAHEGEDSLLDRGDVDATTDSTVSEFRPGFAIGPYKLLQQLGEGGMGVVYMAEQREPVKRRVALKIIKPGMDSKQVLARFEGERQALAMMDHPNIARVLDAGITDSGRPYFIMDLVKGIPIDQYCDEHGLDTRSRLQLFTKVCRALQHAHHKGIVHRDVKPSNVLVAEFDNEVVPKIIDFGVAKAIDQQLTERTMFTQFGQVVGTPEYMSPEQAKLNQLDVDTRSDVYSLGVLLYELLTGATPFDQQRLRSVAFDELLRIIREEDPPRPSARLSTVNELPTVASRRKSEPRKLSVLLRGELDWLVMKAMDKERSRRYDSASAFADDVQRYLSGDAVFACPPSRLYQARKLANRHRPALIVATLVGIAILLGLVGTTSMAFIAHQNLAALQERVIEDAFLAVLLYDPDKDTLIEYAELVGVPQSTLSALKGLARLNEGENANALALTLEATRLDPSDFAAWCAARIVSKVSTDFHMTMYLDASMEANNIDLSNGHRNDYEWLLSLQASDGSFEEANELVRRHPTWTAARMMRAAVLSPDSAVREDIEVALQDISVVRYVSPSSPIVAWVDHLVHVRAHNCLERMGATVAADELQTKVKQKLDRLKDFPNCVLARVALMWHFREIGDIEREKQEQEAALNLGFGGKAIRGIEAYRKGQVGNAIRMFDQEPYPLALVWKGFAQSEIDRDGALRTYHEFMAMDSLKPSSRLDAVNILLLVGAPMDVMVGELDKILFQLQDTDAESPEFREIARHRKYLLGEIDEAEFLGHDLPAEQVLNAHFTMGMKCLWSGNREGAISHFRVVSEPLTLGMPHAHWARVFRERLEKVQEQSAKEPDVVLNLARPLAIPSSCLLTAPRFKRAFCGQQLSYGCRRQWRGFRVTQMVPTVVT